MPPDFAEIRRRCDGMMRAETYERIYETARQAKGNTFVEIGTAHGASTVCLALAMRDTGRSGTIYTFDRFGRSGRTKYKDASQNPGIARAAIEYFGVAGLVRIIEGDAGKNAGQVPGGQLGLLMMDADGRIDRDMASFYDRLLPDAPVIIDDMADRVRVKLRGDGTARVDQKHKLTFHLVESAVKHGLLAEAELDGETWFGRRCAKRFDQWPPQSILNAYRKLVFADARVQC